ncbi:hypothetical protein IAQ61_002233, partial [Plenodomus lingam]|uniref:uncharacterized protein n=1 Tax=Leptosphaeria maculans TaxID=5022 RepID=UPI00331A3863
TVTLCAAKLARISLSADLVTVRITFRNSSQGGRHADGGSHPLGIGQLLNNDTKASGQRCRHESDRTMGVSNVVAIGRAHALHKLFRSQEAPGGSGSANDARHFPLAPRWPFLVGIKAGCQRTAHLRAHYRLSRHGDEQIELRAHMQGRWSRLKHQALRHAFIQTMNPGVTLRKRARLACIVGDEDGNGGRNEGEWPLSGLLLRHREWMKPRLFLPARCVFVLGHARNEMRLPRKFKSTSVCSVQAGTLHTLLSIVSRSVKHGQCKGHQRPVLTRFPISAETQGRWRARRADWQSILELREHHQGVSGFGIESATSGLPH